jgi:NADP-dependent 3-hydroxy acid dehydrogenase YdfG
MNSIVGKKIIVTGATSGIGRSTTLALLKGGAQVAFCGKSKDKMESLLQEASLLSKEKYFAKAFDIIEESEIKTFVQEAKQKLGGIDILINCAGLNSARGKVEDIKLSDLEYMIKVNCIAPFIFIQEVIRDMTKQKNGFVINVLSTVCLFSNEGIGAYTASKAAIDALTKVLRKEVRKDNIRITSIYPGGVNTAFRAQDRPEYLHPDDVRDSILNVITAGANVALDDIIIRPIVETNF